MMLEEIFCRVDDFCKELTLTAPEYLLKSDKKTRKRCLCTSEIITSIILFQQSKYKVFKHFYLDEISQGSLRSAFPYAPSYSRFVSLKPQVAPTLFAFLSSHKKTSQGVHFMDSTAISVCKNKRISSHKVFRGLAEIGKTTMGWFYGYKLHCICDALGNLCNFFITSGNIDDRNPVEKITKNITGIIYADKGYISKNLFQTLMANGLKLVTGVRSNMKNRLMLMQDKILLRKRSIIETLFGQLKETLHLQHTRHRSPVNGFVNICACLVAYIFQEKKAKIRFSPQDIELLSLGR